MPPINTAWQRAAGSCGFNIGNRPVDATYINGRALFAFESSLSRPRKPFFTCVVAGIMSCGGNTLDEAKANGVRFALESGGSGTDRKLSAREFRSIVASPDVLPRSGL